MAIQEVEPRELDTVQLNPGDNVRVTTEIGTIYDIEAKLVLEGLLQSTVTRRPVERPNLRVEEDVIEQAYIFTYQGVGQIAVGQRFEVVGLRAKTEERVNFRTTPVSSIAYTEPTEQI